MISITLDIDWAPPEVIDYSLNLLSQYNIKATIFSTHDVIIEGHEVGLHPNFESNLSHEDALKKLQDIYPNAIGVRSHALIISSRIYDLYADHKLKYSSSYYVNEQPFNPFNTIRDILEIPIFFEDDLYFKKGDMSFNANNINFPLESIKVFDFHPVHLFLNTHSTEHYLSSKKYYHNAKELKRCRVKKKGVCDLFHELMEVISKTNSPYTTLGDIYHNQK